MQAAGGDVPSTWWSFSLNVLAEISVKLLITKLLLSLCTL